MIEHYMKRGYPFNILKNHMLRANRFIQNDLLEVRPKERNTTPVMTTKYKPRNPNIKGFIHDNWNRIQHSNGCANTFPDKPVIGFKRLPNLRDMLTKATISSHQVIWSRKNQYPLPARDWVNVNTTL